MPSIPYVFSASGYKEVENAFKSIEARANASERATKAWSKATDASAKAANNNARAQAKAEKVGGQYGPGRKEWYRAQEQAQREATRSHERSTKQKERAEREASRRLAKEWRDEHRLKERQAQNEAKITHERFRQNMMNLGREHLARQKIAASHRAAFAHTLGTGFGMAGRAALALGGVIGGASGGMTGAAMRKGLELQEAAASLAVRSRMMGQAAADPNKIREEFERAAIASKGLDAMEIAEAVQAIVSRTGKVDLARSWEGTMGTTMMASGVRGGDLGNVMSTMMEKFNITSVQDMRQAMADLTFQGKQGAFELSDMAQYMGEVGAAAERFGGFKSGKGVRTIGGMMQLARQSTGSGAEAATAVETMFRQLVSASKDIKKQTGVDVFRDKNKTKTYDFMELIPKIIAGAKGNNATLQGIFDVRGIRAVSPLIAKFNELRASGASVDKAMAGVTAMMNGAMETGATWSDMQQDAALRQQTPQAQLRHAWEITASTITGKALPAVAALASKFASWISDDRVQVGLGKLAEAVVGTAEVIGDAAGWIFEQMMSLGLVDDEEVARYKQKKAVDAAQSRVEELLPQNPEERKAALETLQNIAKNPEVIAETKGMAPLERARRQAWYAEQTKAVSPELANAFYQGKEVVSAVRDITFAEPNAPKSTTGADVGGTIGGPIGMLVGAAISRGAEVMSYPPAQKQAAQPGAPLTTDQAVAQLDALTGALQNATGKINSAAAQVGVKSDIWGGFGP